jgi:hypothetical protein
MLTQRAKIVFQARFRAQYLYYDTSNTTINCQEKDDKTPLTELEQMCYLFIA